MQIEIDIIEIIKEILGRISWHDIFTKSQDAFISLPTELKTILMAGIAIAIVVGILKKAYAIVKYTAIAGAVYMLLAYLHVI